MRIRRTKSQSAVQPEAIEPPADALYRASIDKIALALKHRGSATPAVLSIDAVDGDLLPPLGTSDLPASLEKAVPSEYRYWLAKDVETASEVRLALVETSLFASENVLDVDGEPTRVVHKTFVAEVDETPSELTKRTPIQAAMLALLASNDSTYVFDLDVEADVQKDVVAKREFTSPWLAAYVDDPESRAIATKHELTCFGLQTRPGVVFVTNAAIDKSTPFLQFEDSSPSDALVRKAFSNTTRLLKADMPEEERYVFGIVLEPDVVDSQGDTYNEKAVRDAAHYFMENFGALGLQHDAIITGKVVILESFIAPAEFAVGEETVKKGTWCLAIRARDEEVWKSIKDGSITGFSIGGSAIRKPE